MSEAPRSGRRRRPGGGRRSTDARVRFDRSPALYLYSGLIIVAGLGALAWATLALPLAGDIAPGDDTRPAMRLVGLGYWILLGLLGSIRVARIRGHGVLTFHLPFVVAAMALGGPVAAGWVAMLATFELREFREVPWFGTLANHAGAALAAIAGGLVLVAVRAGLASTGLAGVQGRDLLALVLGTATFTTLSIAIAIGVVVLRDRLTIGEFFSVYDGAHRSTAATEAVLGWLLALVFRSVGWWAPIVCALLVLLTWDAYDALETARLDAMTGLLARVGFDRRLDHAVRRARRGWEAGVLVAIDLDGFKAINDTLGHAAGDAIIRATGGRLDRSIRLTDSAARLGGDEFAVLFVGIDEERTAERLARRLLTAIRQPIAFDAGEVSVGASLGVAMLRRGDREASADALHRLADAAMYEAKRAGGGVHLHGPECPGLAAADAVVNAFAPG